MKKIFTIEREIEINDDIMDELANNIIQRLSDNITANEIDAELIEDQLEWEDFTDNNYDDWLLTDLDDDDKEWLVRKISKIVKAKILLREANEDDEEDDDDDPAALAFSE